MTSNQSTGSTGAGNEKSADKGKGCAWRGLGFLSAVLVIALASGLITALLVNIFQRQQEAKNPYLRLVEVGEETTDPEPWGVNWPREFDGYTRTVEISKTNFGGGDASPQEKATNYPFLTRMFAGYAFALDYRDRRGHAYMLLDQEKTRRVTERPQPGACLHCHASVIPTYRRLGQGDVQKGFVQLTAMKYWDAHKEVEKTGSLNPVPGAAGKQEFQQVAGAHPVSCVDCHDPKSMALRVTRPGFITGIKALKNHQGIPDYDPNRDASRQEMRSYVCAQCHVEYYCGPKVTLLFPWANGLKVEEIEQFYDNYKFPDGHRFYDWTHAETGAELLKAQHPEFETWSQGVHARSGVACADCHMPYERQGALKVSDHWIRSPMLHINRSCQQCHNYPEEEIKSRVEGIQQKNYALLQRAGSAVTDMLDAIKKIRQPVDQTNLAEAQTKAQDLLAKDAGFATSAQDLQDKKLKDETRKNLDTKWQEYIAAHPTLHEVLELHRKAQWRLDFVAAENSMGFHAPQETARVLGEAIDYARQAQVAAEKLGHGG